MGDDLDDLIEKLRTEKNERRREVIIDKICRLRNVDNFDVSRTSSRGSHSWSPSSVDGSGNGHSFLWNLIVGIILFPLLLVLSILKLIFWIFLFIIKAPIIMTLFIIKLIIANVINAVIRMVVIAFIAHCLLLWYFNRGYNFMDVLKLLNISSFPFSPTIPRQLFDNQYDGYAHGRHDYNDHFRN